MRTRLKWMLQRLSFPVLFGGAGLAAWWGYAPGAVAWLMPAIVAAVGIITFGLEWVLPYERAWNRGGGERTDAIYLALTSAFVRIAEACAWTLAAWLVSTPVLQGGSVWPREWPVIAQLFLAFAIGDFLPYLYHRASHESTGFLWRVHAIHHAPERLYTLNFARFHPLNAVLTAGLTLLPLAVLGAPAPVLFVAAILHNVHGVLSHANVDFRLGPMNWLFSMAELHRWHHARDPKLANGNYGATVLLWDWLFGTRRYPAERVKSSEVGLWSGSTVPTTLFAQLAFPFRRTPTTPMVFVRSAKPGLTWRCCGLA